MYSFICKLKMCVFGSDSPTKLLPVDLLAMAFSLLSFKYAFRLATCSSICRWFLILKRHSFLFDGRCSFVGFFLVSSICGLCHLQSMCVHNGYNFRLIYVEFRLNFIYEIPHFGRKKTSENNGKRQKLTKYDPFKSANYFRKVVTCAFSLRHLYGLTGFPAPPNCWNFLEQTSFR